MKKKIIALLLLICMLAVLCGCIKKSPAPAPRVEDKNISQKEKTKEIIDEVPKEDAVEKILGDMSLDEKIFQMMFVAPEDITKVAQVYSAGEATKAAIEKYPVGGIIYFRENLKTREQTIEMISNTQSYSDIPLFISVDEEGGSVSRLSGNPQMGVTKHPTMKEVGETKNPENAYKVGETLATDLKGLGFNVDFAPVADVLVSKNNIEIADRSFGYEAENVALMVENVVLGLEENGVSATLKHFPGSGATTKDTHDGYSANPRTLEELKNTEFLPFKKGIDAGSDFVMVSHMTLTNATEEKLPCSLSEEVIQGMLIEELGFDGVIITDSLRMGAIADNYAPEELGVMCIKAGNDMLLMLKDIDAAHKGISDAVKSGEITEERIDESVRKILKLKIEKGLW